MSVKSNHLIIFTAATLVGAVTTIDSQPKEFTTSCTILLIILLFPEPALPWIRIRFIRLFCSHCLVVYAEFEIYIFAKLDLDQMIK